MASIINEYPDPVLPVNIVNIANETTDKLQPEQESNEILLLEDILNEQNQEIEEELNPIPQNIDEITALYSDPTHSNQAQREGSSHTFLKPKESMYTLHYAARDGDLLKVSKMIQNGHDVNITDKYGAKPIHVASLFGRTDVVKLLIKNGSKLDHGFGDQSPLHLALAKKHYELARVLITEGKADPYDITSKGVVALNMVLDALEADIRLLHQQGTKPQLEHEIKEIITTIDAFSQRCGKFCFYLTLLPGQKVPLGTPVSAHLKVLAALAHNEELRTKIVDLSNKIAAYDHSEPLFIELKNFFQTFPTGGTYPLTLGKGFQVLIQANGHFEVFTTEFVHDSLKAYTQQLRLGKPEALKIHVFNQLIEIFGHAVEFVNASGDMKTAQKALELYHQDKTVLLPSGWMGHFVDVFLTKKHAIYGVANSGDRDENDIPGITFNRIQDTNKVNEQFIHKALINYSDKGGLLHDAAYEYGFMEKLGSIKKPAQVFGNCTLESHLDAVEGILFIELLNIGVDENNALRLAKEYSNDWNHFHSDYAIDRLLTMPQALPASAIVDVFFQIYKKKGTPEFTQHEQHQLHKISAVLVSKDYMDSFKSWLHTVKESKINMDGLHQIFKEYGVNVKAIAAEPVAETGILDFLGKIGAVLLGDEKHHLVKHLPDAMDQDHGAHAMHIEVMGPQQAPHQHDVMMLEQVHI